ncbi:MAG: hypothetical protein HBSAPP02_28570 [Phycisphaerae bacterium]|nr:MAG: hypothetical protein HBSAPP02_28570 [Phycisphaerae bacterium]
MLILKERKTNGPNFSAQRRQVGGNRKPRSFGICPVCLCIVGPLDHLSRKFCSTACKAKAQTTGRRRRRATITKARSAQSLLRYYVKTGLIVRPTRCEGCGATDRRIEAAHFNYDEPLRVRWLCRSCHVRWDKREPKGATFVVSVNGKDPCRSNAPRSCEALVEGS